MKRPIVELLEKQPDDLKTYLIELRKEQFSLSMQQTSGQQPKPHELRRVRREIARTKFLLGRTSLGTPQ